MDEAEDWPTRRDRLFEQARKQRRRDEIFATAATIVVLVANFGYLIRGTEASFRSSVIMLLTVIAIFAARVRR